MTTDAYAALVHLAERERQLVDDGRYEELAAVTAERDAVIATLPAQAPPTARPALERAFALQTVTAAVLRASMAELRHEMVAIDRGRGVARAYAGPAATVAVASVDAAA